MGWNEQKLWVERSLLKSKAFCSLKNSSAIVYFHFLIKRIMAKSVRKRGRVQWVITNNGRITFTYSEAQKNLGYTKSRFSRALKELVKNGLIDIKHTGGGFAGDSNEFAISDRWKDYGTPDFEKKTMPKDTREGRGFAVIHKRERQEQGGRTCQKPKLSRRKIKSK
ncbi:hypothetical protein N9219_01640 [bacterium]|nr:hypothetical protein [bacterium]